MTQAQDSFADIEYLIAPLQDKLKTCPIEAVANTQLSRPFSDSVLYFLGKLSEQLLKGANSNISSELVSLGYWIRPAQLKKFEQQFSSSGNRLIKPLGSVLHIAPSNVDIQFFYSWVLSLLMGNANIVRVSQVESEMKTQLVSILAELLSKPEHHQIAQTNLFVTWPHNDAMTQALSHKVNARMLWGSDDSVNHIRSLGCNVACRDIVFSDKYSVSVVNFDASNESRQFAEALSRDISAFSQRACSSPKVIFCCSKDSTFPQAVLEQINELGKKNSFEPGRTINHLVTKQLLQAKGLLSDDITLSNIQVLKLTDFSPGILNWHAGESQLFWVNLETPEQVVEYIDEKCQTISYFDIDKKQLLSIIEQMPINGVDRVVPLGKALEFDVIWDGYDLLSQLSRTITVN